MRQVRALAGRYHKIAYRILERVGFRSGEAGDYASHSVHPVGQVDARKSHVPFVYVGPAAIVLCVKERARNFFPAARDYLIERVLEIFESLRERVCLREVKRRHRRIFLARFEKPLARRAHYLARDSRLIDRAGHSGNGTVIPHAAPGRDGRSGDHVARVRRYLGYHLGLSHEAHVEHDQIKLAARHRGRGALERAFQLGERHNAGARRVLIGEQPFPAHSVIPKNQRCALRGVSR